MKIRKVDRCKILPNIILKAVKAVKIHNLFIRQALRFYKLPCIKWLLQKILNM